MKIVHAIPSLTLERGGPSTVLRAITGYQASLGHQVTVVTTDQGVRRGEHNLVLSSDVEVHRMPVYGPDRIAYAPGLAKVLSRCLRGTDILHVHSVFTHPVHAALRMAGSAGLPVVLRPCGQLHRYSLGRSRWRKSLYLWAFGSMIRRICSAWHFTSEAEGAQSWPWDTSPCFVVPNGIEPSEFQQSANEVHQTLERACPALGGAPYVLFLARLHPKKRLDLLLQAFLAGAPPGYKLLVAGPDERGLWPQLAARLLARHTDAQRVIRIGAVQGPTKAALLAGATLFALPSEHENFGNTVLEALAAGTPTLLSPHVDCAAEIVKAGFGHAAPLEARSWSERLDALLTDPDSLRGTGREGQAWVTKHYHWRGITQRLLAFYERVLAARGQTGLHESTRPIEQIGS